MSNVAEYLDKKGFQYNIKTRAKGDQAVMNCPFCDDTEHKFEINIGDGDKAGLWRCWHQNSCNRQGTFWQLRQALGDAPTPVNADDLRGARKKYTRPDIKAKRIDDHWTHWFTVRRRLSRETVKRFRIALTASGDIIFPFYKDGKLVNAKYRGPDKKFYQEANAEQTLFGRQLLDAGLKDLVITEGEIDAMTLWEYQIPAVSMPSGASNLDWIENEWEFLERFDQIFLCFDMDKSGEEAVSKVVKRLGWDWSIRRPRLPFKDANECLIQGVTAAEMTDFLFGPTSQEIRPAEVVSLAEYSRRDHEVAEQPSVPMSIHGLQEKLDGWRMGELTMVGGRDGSGKTTFLSQNTADLLKREQTVCLGSFEMKPRKLIHDLMKQSGFIDLAHFIEAYGHQLFFIDILGEIEEPKLLDLMKYAAHRFGVRFFVVDSIGRVKPKRETGLDYYQRQKETANRLVSFAKDKDVHVYLVNHARKAESSNQRLSKDDLEGSGWMKNLADNVILVERVRTKPKDPAEPKIDEIITVAKNRYNGREGRVKFVFDALRICYDEVR